MNIFGTPGDDWLQGTLLADVMHGSLGNDIYTLNHLGDRIIEEVYGGIDTVCHLGQNQSVKLPRNCERLAFGENTKTGVGNELDNHITGNGTSNKIDGKAGDDWIDGTGDPDILIGGRGADLFHYGNINDSAAGWYDTIKDFKGTDGDLIDLRDLHTNGLAPDEFTEFIEFIGSRDFSEAGAGELRFRSGLVQADVNGDGAVDFQIKLAGKVTITEDYFLL